mmetsp:Transcript_52486/g.162901  ORF Transcript_52486/g.162901 Transcript_52486/m.162901 type:complete len:224 (-) Transcript_52486:344-1015(-)
MVVPVEPEDLRPFGADERRRPLQHISMDQIEGRVEWSSGVIQEARPLLLVLVVPDCEEVLDLLVITKQRPVEVSRQEDSAVFCLGVYPTLPLKVLDLGLSILQNNLVLVGDDVGIENGFSYPVLLSDLGLVLVQQDLDLDPLRAASPTYLNHHVDFGGCRDAVQEQGEPHLRLTSLHWEGFVELVDGHGAALLLLLNVLGYHPSKAAPNPRGPLSVFSSSEVK